MPIEDEDQVRARRRQEYVSPWAWRSKKHEGLRFIIGKQA